MESLGSKIQKSVAIGGNVMLCYVMLCYVLLLLDSSLIQTRRRNTKFSSTDQMNADYTTKSLHGKQFKTV